MNHHDRLWSLSKKGRSPGRRADLWGLPVNETVDRLESRYGTGVATAVVGPAGERGVRFASIIAERTHQAARTGMGAVLGAKRVKAVIIASEERARGRPRGLRAADSRGPSPGAA